MARRRSLEAGCRMTATPEELATDGGIYELYAEQPPLRTVLASKVEIRSVDWIENH